MPHRLLLIADDRDDGAGLAEARAIATGLDRAAYQVVVVRLTDARPPQPIGFLDDHATAETNIAYAPRWRFDPWTIWRLTQLIAKERPAVVHTLGNAAGRYGRFACRMAGQTGIVASQLDTDFDRHPLSAALVRKWFARRSTTIVETAREFHAAVEAGYPQDRLRVIRTSPPPFPSATISREALCRQFGAPPDTRFIAVLAPLVPPRRIKEAIWGYSIVRCVRPDAHLLIVGQGPQRRELELFRDAEDCREGVHIDTTPFAAATYRDHLDAVWALDLLPKPSFALRRAVASGIPLIAIDTPSNRDYFADAQAATWIPLGSRPALAQATLRALENPAQSYAPGHSATPIREYADVYRSIE